MDEYLVRVYEADARSGMGVEEAPISVAALAARACRNRVDRCLPRDCMSLLGALLLLLKVGDWGDVNVALAFCINRRPTSDRPESILITA